jgi:hypothetical protein
MLAAERLTNGTAERQAIVRDTEQLQALVTAKQAREPVDFRAIHQVASRMTQAAYESWKKAALAQTAPRTTPHE